MIIGIIAVLAGAGVYGYYFLQVTKLAAQMMYLTLLEADPELDAACNTALAVQSALDTARKEDDYVTLLQEYVSAAGTVNTELLELLVEKMPEGTEIRDVSISQDSVSLSLTAPDIGAASRLEKNLRETGVFSQVSLSSITRRAGDSPEEPGGEVVFSCSATLKEGALR